MAHLGGRGQVKSYTGFLPSFAPWRVTTGEGDSQLNSYFSKRSGATRGIAKTTSYACLFVFASLREKARSMLSEMLELAPSLASQPYL